MVWIFQFVLSVAGVGRLGFTDLRWSQRARSHESVTGWLGLRRYWLYAAFCQHCVGKSAVKLACTQLCCWIGKQSWHLIALPKKFRCSALQSQPLIVWCFPILSLSPWNRDFVISRWHGTRLIMELLAAMWPHVCPIFVNTISQQRVAGILLTWNKHPLRHELISTWVWTDMHVTWNVTGWHTHTHTYNCKMVILACLLIEMVVRIIVGCVLWDRTQQCCKPLHTPATQMPQKPSNQNRNWYTLKNKWNFCMNVSTLSLNTLLFKLT